MPVPGYQALPKLAALLTTGAGARAPADPVGAACRRRMVGTVRLTGQAESGCGAVSQCLSKFGRGVPSTAIAPTTSSQNGSTPKPGIASRASPGKSSHCRPSTMNSSSAVPRSTTHTIGGKGAAKAPMASEMPAMAKARASRFLENLRVFEIGVPALVDCFLGSVGGGVIWVWSAVIANSFHLAVGPPTNCVCAARIISLCTAS